MISLINVLLIMNRDDFSLTSAYSAHAVSAGDIGRNYVLHRADKLCPRRRYHNGLGKLPLFMIPADMTRYDIAPTDKGA